MCRGDVERGLFVASAAMRGGATSSISVYGRWSNPPFLGRGLRTADLLALNLPDGYPLSDAKSLIERGMCELETINR